MPADCQPARLGDLRRGGASAAERYGQPHAPRDLPAAEPEDRIVRVGPRRAERRERFHRHAGQVARGSPASGSVFERRTQSSPLPSSAASTSPHARAAVSLRRSPAIRRTEHSAMSSRRAVDWIAAPIAARRTFRVDAETVSASAARWAATVSGAAGAGE